MQLPTSDSVTDYRGMQTQVRDILLGEYFMLLRFILLALINTRETVHRSITAKKW